MAQHGAAHGAAGHAGDRKAGFFSSLGKDIKNFAKKLDANMPKATTGGRPLVTDVPWGEEPTLVAVGSSRIVSQRLERLPSRKHTMRVNSPEVTAWDGTAPGPHPGAMPMGGLGALALPGLEHQARQSLLITLATYNLQERMVKGDGACQFRALSDQLYGNEQHHGTVRARAVTQVRVWPVACCL